MSLEHLLKPRSLAIVGASADPKKIAGMIVQFLHASGFDGRVYAVNPRYPKILDWPCHPTVADLPETVDVLVVVVPVAVAFEALEQAAARGVPFVVLMTGGFGEGTSGAAGDERCERLRALCARTGMRVIGPNTVGLVNFRDRLPLTFADWYGRDTGQRGGVAILTHSGSVGGLIFSTLQANGVGVDFWVATGNEAVLEIADFIDHLAGDPRVGIIACFMEGVGDGRRFMAAARKARAAGQRIVVLKAGDGEASLRSTAAHTIKRSTAPDVYRAVFRDLGIVVVRSLQELAGAVKLLSMPGKGPFRSFGILSASGGACSLIADHATRAGVDLPELDAGIQQRLGQAIPEYGSTRNPVDLSADVVSRREIVDRTLEVLADDRRVDVWMVFGRPVTDRYAAEIGEFARRTGKAVVASTGVPMRPEIARVLAEAGVPSLEDPEICLRALGAIVRAAQSGRPASPVDDAAVGDATVGDAAAVARRCGDPLPAGDAAARLARHGVSLPDDASAPAPADDAFPLESLVLALEQDPDFGPILSLRHGGPSPGRDPGRTLLPLPLDERGITALVADFLASAPASLSRFEAGLVDLAGAVHALYRDAADVAAIALRVRPGPAGLAIRGATLLRTRR